MNDLETWKQLMNEHDLFIANEYRLLKANEIEQIRENWRVLRNGALINLNDHLQSMGKKGQLMGMDVEDDQLYPYIPEKFQFLFFKYSRILDFKMGFFPKGMIFIKE